MSDRQKQEKRSVSLSDLVREAVRIRWIILELHKASGLPRVVSYSGFPGGDLFDTEAEAYEIAECCRVEQGERHEVYTVAKVIVPW